MSLYYFAFFFPLCLSWFHMSWNIPFISLSQLSWLCPLPRYCPNPSFCWWGRMLQRELMLCQCYSAAAKTLTCYQHLSRYQCKAQHGESCYGEINSVSDRHSIALFSQNLEIIGMVRKPVPYGFNILKCTCKWSVNYLVQT